MQEKRPGGSDDPEESKFLWVKKLRAEEQKGLSPADIARREAERRERNRIELHRLEQQRLKWDAEKEQKLLEKVSRWKFKR
jgi:hypothetical protein